MLVNINRRSLDSLPLIQSLIDILQSRQVELGIENSNLYYDFPVFKDLDDDVVVAQIMLISSQHGIVIFETSDIVEPQNFKAALAQYRANIDNIFTTVHTRLLKNKNLRRDRVSLNVPINAILYAPLLNSTEFNDDESVEVINTEADLIAFFVGNRSPIEGLIFKEVKATIEGSKGLIVQAKREHVAKNTKGDLVNELEQEIASFDQYQRSAYMSLLTGASRVRGLAGSGKTVVLAMKAAITHLRDPNAKIAFTFYTKSLYQHIQRLITRFYRQFDDKDPNWDKIEIIHAWGGYSNPGLYYNVCRYHGVTPLNYNDAIRLSSEPFDYACLDLLSNKLNVVYDYVFIDEGQDFPVSFLKLCSKITRENRFIWAYDELQNIFQVSTPSPKEIFGVSETGESMVELQDDIILYKCYRNPREILVVAHALGFGIYSDAIVQMIDTPEYWTDIGYRLKSGELIVGNVVELERPEENSLKSISDKFPIDDIIRTFKAESVNEEVEKVVSAIRQDIEGGLLPEDILVVSVDDRYAKTYLTMVQELLSEHGIKCNNIHADKYSVRDFQMKSQVTLSTVHKAKGNEAYSVYILGIDSLFALNPNIRKRNLFFTAITRAKAWVTLSGLSVSAARCFKEVTAAKANFPLLKFVFPDVKALKIMQRDIEDRSLRKSKDEKVIDELLEHFTAEELERLIEQRTKKGDRK